MKRPAFELSNQELSFLFSHFYPGVVIGLRNRYGLIEEDNGRSHNEENLTKISLFQKGLLIIDPESKQAIPVNSLVQQLKALVRSKKCLFFHIKNNLQMTEETITFYLDDDFPVALQIVDDTHYKTLPFENNKEIVEIILKHLDINNVVDEKLSYLLSREELASQNPLLDPGNIDEETPQGSNEKQVIKSSNFSNPEKSCLILTITKREDVQAWFPYGFDVFIKGNYAWSVKPVDTSCGMFMVSSVSKEKVESQLEQILL